MTRLLIFALLITGLTCCNSQPSVNYANQLENCLSTSEISLLNSLCQSFESHITSTYKLSVTEAYRHYLMQLANTSFSQDFFKYESFESDVDKFYNSSFYEKSWAKASSFREEQKLELPPVYGETKQQEAYDPVILNPNGEYVQCLLHKNKVKAMNDYLEIVKAGLDVSPALVASALSENLSEQDLNNEITRLIIAINFHYQISLYVTGRK